MFIRFHILFFIILCLSFPPSFANEHGGDEHGGGGGHEAPKADEHGGGGHEAPKADEHGGGEHGAAAEAPKFSGPAWAEVETKISFLETKIRAKESTIEKLLEEKQHLDERSPRIQEIMGEVTKETGELRKSKEELDKQKTILHYRFPERGADPKRSYQKHKEQTPEELDAAAGVDGKLKKAFHRAEQQYGRKEVKPTPTPEHLLPHSKGRKKMRPDVPEGVILQK
jgi:hypothetical protein